MTKFLVSTHYRNVFEKNRGPHKLFVEFGNVEKHKIKNDVVKNKGHFLANQLQPSGVKMFFRFFQIFFYQIWTYKISAILKKKQNFENILLGP